MEFGATGALAVLFPIADQKIANQQKIGFVIPNPFSGEESSVPASFFDVQLTKCEFKFPALSL
jgi:hypothetical protein